MGKKAWVKPVTLVQKFEANEPCAADPCWRVTCEWTGTGHSFCHDPDHYRFVHDDNDGKADRMQVNHKVWIDYWYDCEFFTDSSFETSLGKNLEEIDIKPGQVVFFRNSEGAEGAPIHYNHMGKVYAVDPSYPNRS